MLNYELQKYSIEGALVNGSRVQKRNSLAGDRHKDGDMATVISSFFLESDWNKLGYLVIFDNSEEIILIAPHRIIAEVALTTIKHFAQIDSATHIVVNLIALIDASEWTDGNFYVIQSDSANIGDLYSNGEFISQ